MHADIDGPALIELLPVVNSAHGVVANPAHVNGESIFGHLLGEDKMERALAFFSLSLCVRVSVVI